MIKDAVVNLTVVGETNKAADYAVSLAEEFGANLLGIAFAYQPIPPVSGLGEMVPAEWMEAEYTAAEEAAKASIRSFEDRARLSGVSARSHLFTAMLAAGSNLFASVARRFDLSIVQQYDPDHATFNDRIIEGVLFGSGRPVLVVPYIQATGIKLDRVIVCWDGRPHAARAVGDAMPFLERAKHVEVLTIGEHGKSEEISGGDIVEHLARHGVAAAPERIVGRDVDAADMILSRLADTGADFLVMGGYGHSRLREVILGGVTREVIRSTAVPVLMSH